jgi:eukaryotic-like serine/threonine-protein kinase
VGPGLPDRGCQGEISGVLVTMSPEQVMGTGCDARSDLFQVGIIFYELLTGEPPFDAQGGWSKTRNIATEDPAPPSSIDAAIPAWLDAIVLRALAKDPHLRYGSAAEFSAELMSAASRIGPIGKCKAG